MKVTRGTISTIMTALAVLVLVAALPSAIRDTVENGRVYLFSRQFLDELPQRFSGPGRFRFVLQPAMAILLGWRGGLADARAGRSAFLYGLLAGGEVRREFLHSGWRATRDLVAMGIVLDAVVQFLIYRQVHPGAALLMGPAMISAPYAVARAAANRTALLKRGGPGRGARKP